MQRTCALVPVKAPALSKSRLTPMLEQDECASLCMAMLSDVLDALNGASSVNEIAVVTSDKHVAKLAQRHGHQVIQDDSGDLCGALDSAARQLAENGVETVLIVPADMPTINSADVDALIAKHRGGLSISPAIRDGGTNALVCSPPDAVAFCYGQDSANKHLQRAEQAGIPSTRLPVPAFFRDVDLPDDLLWLNNQQCGQHTLDFLRESGINARLKPGATGTS